MQGPLLLGDVKWLRARLSVPNYIQTLALPFSGQGCQYQTTFTHWLYHFQGTWLCGFWSVSLSLDSLLQTGAIDGISVTGFFAGFSEIMQEDSFEHRKNSVKLAVIIGGKVSRFKWMIPTLEDQCIFLGFPVSFTESQVWQRWWTFQCGVSGKVCGRVPFAPHPKPHCP